MRRMIHAVMHDMEKEKSYLFLSVTVPNTSNDDVLFTHVAYIYRLSVGSDAESLYSKDADVTCKSGK